MNTSIKHLKHIPSVILHEIYIGKDSLFYKGNEVLIAIVSDNPQLSCGCNSSQLVRVVNNKGIPVFEKLSDNFEINKYRIIISPFISSEWISYWDDFYKINPFYKPLWVLS